MATANPNTKPATPVKALRIVSKSPAGTFWRAGRAFTSAPMNVPISELSPKQITALYAEKMLDVTEVEIDPAAAGDAPKE